MITKFICTVHSEHLANIDDFKSLSDHRFVCSKITIIATKLLHHPIISDVNKDLGPKAKAKAKNFNFGLKDQG